MEATPFECRKNLRKSYPKTTAVFPAIKRPSPSKNRTSAKAIQPSSKEANLSSSGITNSQQGIATSKTISTNFKSCSTSSGSTNRSVTSAFAPPSGRWSKNSLRSAKEYRHLSPSIAFHKKLLRYLHDLNLCKFALIHLSQI